MTELLTVINQLEVKVLDESDASDTYAKNLPPGGKDKWALIQFPDGKTLWQPKHSFTFTTPKISDMSKVRLEVND